MLDTCGYCVEEAIKMCHISFVLCVEMQEGLGSWGGQGGGDFSRAQLWLLCSSSGSSLVNGSGNFAC